jgi:hypothetical protein
VSGDSAPYEAPSPPAAAVRSALLEPGAVWPACGAASICEVPALALAALGVPRPELPDQLRSLVGGPYRRVVVLILDALGSNQLEYHRANRPAVARLLQAGMPARLTSTFPSTTTVALTALYTGLTPLQHGIPGHYGYLDELDGTADLLLFSPAEHPTRNLYGQRGIQVEQLFPMETVFHQAAAAGLSSVSLTRRAFVRSPLGRLHHRGTQPHGALTDADLLVRLRRLLESDEEPALLYAYWDDVDGLSHEYGPFAEEVGAWLDSFCGTLAREVLDLLPPAARRDTLLLLTADHGQTEVHEREALLLGSREELQDGIPAGQRRAPYFRGRPGCREALGAALQQLGPSVGVVAARDALAAGLFGAPTTSPEVRERFLQRTGHWIAVCRGGATVHRGHSLAAGVLPRGAHGALSEHEMVVPLLALPLMEWR